MAAALEEYGATLTGASKEEYDAAAPHLAALVRQNFVEGEAVPIAVSLVASGHGMTKDGKSVQNNVQVKLEYSYTKVLA